MPSVAALLLSTALVSPAAAQSPGLLTDPDSWRTAEYRAQWGLEAIRAADAYARGVDGTGVTIGVVESGIAYAGHRELVGRYLGGYDYAQGTPFAAPSDHAVGVSSVIAGNRDGAGIHGVAPGAMLVSGGLGADGRIDPSNVAPAYADLLARGVRLINNSWGSSISIAELTRQDILTFVPGELAAYRQAVEAGALLVRAAGNDGRAQPGYQAGLPYYFPELERGWLTVTATGPGYEPWYTNRCGVAKNWCLAAPGGGDWWDEYPEDPIIVADGTGGYTKVNGTSFAAPHVSGAAALVWQMFPFFSADQVRQTLLGTALDIGAPGVDEVYGYGMLDAGRAVLGPGRFDWGDFVVEQPGGVAHFGNDIVGAGGLVKRGAGELVLTGNSAYAGATRVEGGFLSVMGSIASPTSVAAAGTLAGTGLITGNVSNAGTVWAGDRNGVGTLRIDGDFVQEAGGLLVQQFGPEGGQNHLAVTGTAGLAGWVALAGERQFLPRQLSMAVLTADRGISGRFAGVEGPFGDGTAPFIRASLRYEPNTAYLDLQGLPFDTPGVCASANQCAVGGALERGLASADQDLRDVALLLQHAGTREGARGALASLSGEVHAGLSTLALGGAGQLGSMISQRLGALRSGQADATSADLPLAYTASAATNPAAAMLMRLPAQATANNNAWARGYGFTGRLGSDANAGGASYRGGGVIGGFDRQITPSFLAGFSFGYSSTDADFRRHSGKGSIDAYEGAFYGSYASGKLRLDGLLGYGRLNFESERSIGFGGLSRQAKADYDGDRFTGALEAGYAFDLGWSTVEPLLGLRYTFLRQGSFSETGAQSIGLAAAGQSASSLLGSIGLRLTREFDLGEGRVAVEARGRWQHEFLDDAVVVDTAFIGAPAASFSVRGPRVARDSAILGVGLSARAGRNLTLFADYDVRLNRDATAHAVTAGLRASW
ncbi:MAG TPA: autotransporter domain-containing protein [Bosea sp. (in: a-proteobacteria)]|jgi:subtilase-type serine protease|uniref:autotransporter domain-containing protein n=1 Tax=Bosea sp. (in: a-proteobacteria) TaxID=1871050 RepID=UPI002E153EED|nr:autotransporter domain-containing protein [Bosea sp. (in: a-proteobacteria)]